MMTAHSSRPMVLAVATIVALASGSNYAFSAYAPQLGERLHISSTKLNIIGIAGNIGVYLSGPFWGRFLDTRSPRIPLILAGILNFGGYGLICAMHGSPQYFVSMEAPPTDGGSLSVTGLMLAIGAMCMTGCGATAGLLSGLVSTTRAFSSSTRATAASVCIAGYGLSAFIFASVFRIACQGNVEAFLGTLAVGTSLPMILGNVVLQQSALVRDKQVRATVHYQAVAVEDEQVSSRYGDTQDRDLGYDTPLANGTDEREAQPVSRILSRIDSSVETCCDQSHDIVGTSLLCEPDFWLLFVFLMLLSGTGLMYINNVGTVVSSLIEVSTVPLETTGQQLHREQATQVSMISVSNCLGRLVIGGASDLLLNRFQMPRHLLLIPVGLLFSLSQTLASQISTEGRLWTVSLTLGFAYGCTFSLLPMLVLESFGVAGFARNWGIVSIAPAIGGNLANILFGRVYDSHTEPVDWTGSPLTCIARQECFNEAFFWTFMACLVATALGIVIAFKRHTASG